jgi:phage terminase large subunit-like protein
MLSKQEKLDAAAALEMMQLAERYKRENRLLLFKPYPKQLQFFEMGTTKRERMFMAGNRVGKSEGGAFETALHLTGAYPEWWTGVRFNHPIKAWAAGVTSLDVRNIAQTKLCGQYGVTSAFGTGMIPKGAFADKPTLARGVTDAFDTIQVHHKTNGIDDGISILSFKSYEQGREKFQGDDLDFGWADEESDSDVYQEFLTRINGPGRMIITFTPLKGRTELVERFEEAHPDRGVVHMSLDEAEHFTEEEKSQRVAGYAAHEREARRHGVPLLGSGKVFLYPEDMISIPFHEYVPPHWKKIWGIDFGVGHPFAAVLMLWDIDNDILIVHQALRLKADDRTPWAAQPLFHASVMRRYGASVPVAWPHDGNQRDKGSGQVIAANYKKAGLLMLPGHATFPEGGYSLEAGIQEMDQRFLTNRLKVSKHCAEWFEEYRFYHRENGEIVKVRDDILSATRIAMMMRRFAKAVPLGTWERNRYDSQARVAEGVDFDVFHV